MRLQLDPLSPSGVSVAPELSKLTNRGGYAGSPDITRVLQPGTNVTFTGNGTQQSPYVVNASGSGGSSPLTTKGDLYGYDTAGNRIPVGADGTVLTADSTKALGVKWGSAGGSGVTRTISPFSANTNAASTASTDYVYIGSGTNTLTLPTAVSNTNGYGVKNSGTGIITIATTSAQTIDGNANIMLTSNQFITVYSDNTNWIIGA